MCAAKKTTKPAETVAENTTSKMLFNHLYEACNILRGPINQDEYKTYVIPLLFFKRISDTYDEETALAYEEYGEDVADFIIRVPAIEELLMPMPAAVPLQLLAYYTSVHRGNDVDKPRNLAKSVTVE